MNFPMAKYLVFSIEDSINASLWNFTLAGHSENLSLFQKAIFYTRKSGKRIIDIIISSMLILFSLPLLAIIALVIKLTSEGSIFFHQERIGYRGKPFKIWKFRTMKTESTKEEHQRYIKFLLKENYNVDNDELLAKYIAYVDERITKIGKFLRASSLDELPQLFNIFLGDMSFVGPRPHPIYEVDEYKEWYKRRLNVKPGLTGWSKLNLRLTPKNYEEAILYDLWYVDNWSLGLDLRIILLTVPFVLLMKDAH